MKLNPVEIMTTHTKRGQPFGSKYSEYYDIIYSDKDYHAETEYVVHLMERFEEGGTLRCLELGCGTGNYTLPLAAKGRHVTGVDRSSGMLASARFKAQRLGINNRVNFKKQDITSLRIRGEFDCGIAMFDILNYILTPGQLRVLFSRVNRLLRPGGLLIFDMWNGSAVKKQGLSERVKIARSDKTTVIRITKPRRLRAKNQTMVNFTNYVLKNGRLLEKFEEAHRVRYYFIPEVRALLRASGFEVLSVHPFMKPSAPARNSDWNITFVSRRKG